MYYYFPPAINQQQVAFGNNNWMYAIKTYSDCRLSLFQADRLTIISFLFLSPPMFAALPRWYTFLLSLHQGAQSLTTYIHLMFDWLNHSNSIFHLITYIVWHTETSWAKICFWNMRFNKVLLLKSYLISYT